MAKKQKKHFLECPFCNEKQEFLEIANNPEAIDEDGLAYKYIEFFKCTKCNRAILAQTELLPDEFNHDNWNYQEYQRLWPISDYTFDNAIPTRVKNLLEEAYRCYKAKAYNACAVMCGKVLEAIGKEFNVTAKYLNEILKELKDKEIIDKRIIEWSDSLRKFRNIGAHVTEEEITSQDAIDLLEFTNAICDYIFVLTKRYEAFKMRISKKKGD